jgi:hypothetical protein
MKTVILLAALASTGTAAPKMEGARLHAGSACYTIVAGDKPIGTTLQTITASREAGRPVWDIVVHQKVGNGAFDMRDHFVVDRATLLPLRMESQRGQAPTDRGFHRISLGYGSRGIHGSRQTASGTAPIDVPLGGATWDGNLWGLAFAALPLKEDGTYALPFWQYDRGFGTFTAHVIGSEEVDTPSGKVAAWIVEAGTGPTELMRYQIGKATRQEIGYNAGSNGQRLGGVCR